MHGPRYRPVRVRGERVNFTLAQLLGVVSVATLTPLPDHHGDALSAVEEPCSALPALGCYRTAIYDGRTQGVATEISVVDITSRPVISPESCPDWEHRFERGCEDVIVSLWFPGARVDADVCYGIRLRQPDGDYYPRTLHTCSPQAFVGWGKWTGELWESGVYTTEFVVSTSGEEIGRVHVTFGVTNHRGGASQPPPSRAG